MPEIDVAHVFPPSFEGNPWSYGIALFGLTLISALSLAHLLTMLHDAHRIRLARTLYYGFRSGERVGLFTLLGSYRAIMAGLFATIVLGALPDVLLLLAWGEASDPTIERLFLVDRACDGAAMVPFVLAVTMKAWVVQALPQRLAEVTRTPLQPLRSFMIARYLKILGLVLVISLGVTIGKASG